MIQLIDPLPLDGADLSRGRLDLDGKIPATVKDSCNIGMACHGVGDPSPFGATVGYVTQRYTPALDVLGLEPDEDGSLDVGFGHGKSI